MTNKRLLSTFETADALGCCQNTVLNMARRHPGFGFMFHRAWRFPIENIEAVKRGESIEDVAAKARAGDAAQAA